MHKPIQGIHHITAVASDPVKNLRFYRDVLGMRLVKKTVNFDDPTTYHFYFGDRVGTPGTLLTFFPWGELPRGRSGAGCVESITFRIPTGSLDWWRQRAAEAEIVPSTIPERFGEPGIRIRDPDGLNLELVETEYADPETAWTDGPVPGDMAIAGFHGATGLVHTEESSAPFLEKLGAERVSGAGNRIRYRVGRSGPGTWFDLLVDPEAPRVLPGCGIVHHIAFGMESGPEQEAMREELASRGVGVSPVIDRTYFHSIYFREPSGILYEVATNGPGFLIDEPEDSLGETLRLPPQHEPGREQIEAVLPPLE